MNQVSGEKDLLDTAKDYFHFVTKFFEPINISAVHIYHSALELSPLSSIVRRLYYHRRRTPFPRVVAGIPDTWEEGIRLCAKDRYHAHTWSPCGRFIAAQAYGTVDILDPLSSELLSTFTRSDPGCAVQLAYSLDGHSLASLSSTSLTIWDIQTGGVAREIECSADSTIPLTWSLDGATICTIACSCLDQYFDVMPRLLDDVYNYTVNVHDVASGTTLSSGTLQSRCKPRLWAHNTSFRVFTIEQGDQDFTINIFEVGSTLTEVESFQIEPWGRPGVILPFSPTTYRISIPSSDLDGLRILDIRTSECLLEVLRDGRGIEFHPHSFSSDGSLFAASSWIGIRTWKYTSGRYTPWREFLSTPVSMFSLFSPQFSPASSSILYNHDGLLQIWRLDSPPVVAHPDGGKSLAVISHCSTYIATGCVANSTVTVTNLISPTPPQFIDTDMYVHALTLTGNVLLVWGDRELVAWRLTEKGIVDGASADRRADRGNSIWTVPTSSPTFTSLTLLVEDQTVAIKYGESNIIHVYHTGTGEVLAPAQVSPHPYAREYVLWDMYRCRHYPHHRDLNVPSIPSEDEWPVTWAALGEGWVKDLEGKHRLWIPAEWRGRGVLRQAGGWLCNKTLLLCPRDTPVIIVF